eukprot:2397224-Pyramimonas_sp.AAC.1
MGCALICIQKTHPLDPFEAKLGVEVRESERAKDSTNKRLVKQRGAPRCVKPTSPSEQTTIVGTEGNNKGERCDALLKQTSLVASWYGKTS